MMLLDPSDIKPEHSKVTSRGRYEEQDGDVKDGVANEKEDKYNIYLSSNSISPQSTVTQLTDTPLNGKYFI